MNRNPQGARYIGGQCGAVVLRRAQARAGESPLLAIPLDEQGRLQPLADEVSWKLRPGDTVTVHRSEETP